jgi:hypothetical protein
MIPFSIGDRCFITHWGETAVFVDQLGCLLQRRNWSQLKWNVFQRVASAGTLNHLVGHLEAKKRRSFKLRAHHGVCNSLAPLEGCYIQCNPTGAQKESIFILRSRQIK